MHFSELVQIFGHHGGCCTCIAESGHKMDIKMSAKFARTYGDKNHTQDDMLQYVQRQELWSEVLLLVDKENGIQADAIQAASACADDRAGTLLSPNIIKTLHKLREPLPYSASWSDMPAPVRGRPAPTWGSTFLSDRVLVTRNELLTLLRSTLLMQSTWNNILRLANLDWDFFGAVQLQSDDKLRKIVGVSKGARRRDFVRLQGSENNTALSAQVIMFVRITGFTITGIIITP